MGVSLCHRLDTIKVPGASIHLSGIESTESIWFGCSEVYVKMLGEVVTSQQPQI